MTKIGINNKLIKKIASLKQKKYRDEFNLFSVEGVKLVKEALASGWPVELGVYTEDAASKGEVAAILTNLANFSIPVFEVSKETYNKITDTKEPQGIMLVLKKRLYCLDDILVGGKNDFKVNQPFIAVLDGVNDPGNAGGLIRTADAAGCSGVVLLKGSADLFGGKTMRAAMGSIFHLPVVCEVETEQLIVALKKHNISLLAAALDDKSAVYHKLDLKKSLAIAFGNEGNGLSREILAKADEKIHIPIIGLAESLNVSVAAGVILYEAARQREIQKL